MVLIVVVNLAFIIENTQINLVPNSITIFESNIN